MAAARSSPEVTSLDAFAPPQIAERLSVVGVRKTDLALHKAFVLAILAGLFIGLGAEFSTLVITSIDIGYGLTRLLAGAVFSLGLILVVVAGAELFTGNNLLTIAWLDGSVSLRRVLMNWFVVFAGNLVGSLALAGLMAATRQWSGADYAVGATALRIAADKAALPFGVALARGILCNLLVCLAVWMCSSARTVSDKVLAILFPITAFVASGFEHSVANMYFVPYGLLLKMQPEVVSAAGLAADRIASLTVGGFLANLIPVTLGNLIGGGALVGMVYWWVYRREARRTEEVPAPALTAMQLPISRPLPLLVEGDIMKTNKSESGPVWLTGFVIASADMFYSGTNERDIYIQDDPQKGFRIWGEVPGGGIAAADLGEVLLELAMTCAAEATLPQAYRRMDMFGKKLGEALAVHIVRSTPAESSLNRAACALECVLESLGVQFVVEQVGDDLSYTLEHCPLCEKSDRTGITQVELAHHGLNALCYSLIHALDPEMKVRLPRKPGADRIFAMGLQSHT